MSEVNTSEKISKNFFKGLFNFLKKDNRTIQYEEIFSTTENKINIKNTNPLEVDEESKVPPCDNSPDLSKNEPDKDIITKQKMRKTNSSIILDEVFKVYPEYSKRQDASIIKKSLKKEIKALKIKLIFLTLIFILSLTFDTLMQVNPTFLSVYAPINFPNVYAVGSIFLFILSLIIGFNIIKGAFIHLFKFTFTSDTAIVLPMITTFFYCIASLIFTENSSSANLFVGLFILNFIFIIFNLLINKKRMLNNLKFITSFKQKYNVDTYMLTDVVSSIESKKRMLAAYQYKTTFLTDFVRNSHAAVRSDAINAKLIPCGMVFSLLCFAFNFILTKNLIDSLAAFNISSLICIPAALSLITNSIIFSLCNYTLKNKAMVIGESGIKKLSKVKNVVLNDTDLYPSDNVILRGIKTFNGKRVDEAILSAAAVMCSLGAPISHVLDKIIMGKRTILTKASDIVYKDEKGIVGWVNGQRVLIGNRELLKEYKVGPPSRIYEQKHKMTNCELTYFAIGHDLVAMFIIEYIPSQNLYDTLYSCVKNGITLFIKTVDSNISRHKIASDFDIDEKNIVMLSYNENQIINEFCDKPIDKSKAFISSFGTCRSLLKTICACKCAENNIKLSIAIQAVELFFNIILVSALIFYMGLSELHNIELIIYILLWFIFTMIASRIKKLK